MKLSPRMKLVLDTNIVLDLYVFRDESVDALRESIERDKQAPVREQRRQGNVVSCLPQRFIDFARFAGRDDSQELVDPAYGCGEHGRSGDGREAHGGVGVSARQVLTGRSAAG